MRIPARVLTFALVSAVLLTTAPVNAAPLGITSETAISVSFGYQYQPVSIISLGASFETPFSVVPFIDSSVVARIGLSVRNVGAGLDIGTTVKAVLFPSLSGGLFAAGLWLDVSGYNIGSSNSTFKIGLGPMLTVNLEPAYLTFSASLLALTNGVFGFDLGIAGRYYIGVFALDLSVDYNTVGWARANFGLRFTL